MKAHEEIVEFDCQGDRCYGILHVPERHSTHGLLIIGRTAADRQAVSFARAAAVRGLPVFRFDFRGRGNCEGPVIPVEESRADMLGGTEALFRAVPTLRTITISGLSEGAAAALFYAYTDPRVTGLVLVNPWIEMEQAVARQHLRQNVSRVWDRKFWTKIRRSGGGYTGAALTLSKLVLNVVKAPKSGDILKEGVIHGLSKFRGDITIILSGEDPATAVFQEAAADCLERLRKQNRLTMHNLPEANHVFSRSDWREQMVDWAVTDTLRTAQKT